MARSKLDIALHIIYRCEGDSCECCDWSDEDRAAIEAMTFEEADRLAIEDDGASGVDAEIEPLAEDYNDDDGMTDAEADADALASAGWGTDEDYGYFGGDD
jgi:hypothetical protein